MLIDNVQQNSPNKVILQRILVNGTEATFLRGTNLRTTLLLPLFRRRIKK